MVGRRRRRRHRELRLLARSRLLALRGKAPRLDLRLLGLLLLLLLLLEREDRRTLVAKALSSAGLAGRWRRLAWLAARSHTAESIQTIGTASKGAASTKGAKARGSRRTAGTHEAAEAAKVTAKATTIPAPPNPRRSTARFAECVCVRSCTRVASRGSRMSTSSTLSVFMSTSISIDRLSFGSGTSRARVGEGHDPRLGGMKTRDGARVKDSATNGTTAMRRPRSYAADQFLMSMARMRSAWLRR